MHQSVPLKELTLIFLGEKARRLQAADKREGHHRVCRVQGGNADFGICCGRWTYCGDPKAPIEFAESLGGLVEPLGDVQCKQSKQGDYL